MESVPERPPLTPRVIRDVLRDIAGIFLVLLGGIGTGVTLYRVDPELLVATLFTVLAVVGVLMTYHRGER